MKALGKILSMDPNTTLFHAYFNHGYGLRNIVSVLAQEKGIILLLLKPDQIEFHSNSRMTSTDSSHYQCIYKCIVNANDIMDYYYNVRDEKGQLIPMYPIHVNVDDLHKITKDLNKSAGLKLTWSSEKTNIIHLTVVNGAMSTETPPLQINLAHNAQIITGDHYESTPNVKVIFQEFRTWLDTVGKQCVEMKIVGKKNSVIIQVLDSNGNPISSKTFKSTAIKEVITVPTYSPPVFEPSLVASTSNVPPVHQTAPLLAPMFTFVDPDEIATVNIPKTLGMFGALMKLTADKHSIIHFYFGKDQPIRIDIGTGNGILSLKVLKEFTPRN